MDSLQERRARREAERERVAAFTAEHADLLSQDVEVVETANESSVDAVPQGDAGDLDKDVRTDRATQAAAEVATNLTEEYLQGA